MVAGNRGVGDGRPGLPADAELPGPQREGGSGVDISGMQASAPREDGITPDVPLPLVSGAGGADSPASTNTASRTSQGAHADQGNDADDVKEEISVDTEVSSDSVKQKQRHQKRGSMRNLEPMKEPAIESERPPLSFPKCVRTAQNQCA